MGLPSSSWNQGACTFHGNNRGQEGNLPSLAQKWYPVISATFCDPKQVKGWGNRIFPHLFSERGYQIKRQKGGLDTEQDKERGQ